MSNEFKTKQVYNTYITYKHMLSKIDKNKLKLYLENNLEVCKKTINKIERKEFDMSKNLLKKTCLKASEDERSSYKSKKIKLHDLLFDLNKFKELLENKLNKL